jgi:hypothetical protein
MLLAVVIVRITLVLVAESVGVGRKASHSVNLLSLDAKLLLGLLESFEPLLSLNEQWAFSLVLLIREIVFGWLGRTATWCAGNITLFVWLHMDSILLLLLRRLLISIFQLWLGVLSRVDWCVVLIRGNDLRWLSLHNRRFLTAAGGVADFACLRIARSAFRLVLINQPFELIFNSQLILPT